MNEELMKELVDIIRQLKNGSPEAFRVLVEQRSSYCWAALAVWMVVACLPLSISLMACRWRAQESKANDRSGYEVVAFFMALLTFIIVGSTVGYLPEAIAPLGKILGAIK